MEKIKHYMLPELTNQLHTSEAMSSIAIAKEVADKINEIVDTINNMNDLTLEKIHEQDGRITQGILYMKDNIANTISDILKVMQDSGELSTVIQESLVPDLADKLNQLLGFMHDEIEVETYRDSINDTKYYMTKIPYTTKLEMGIANDLNSLDTLESPIHFAHRKRAYFVCNAGLADEYDKAMGFTMKDGVILKNAPYKTDFDLLAIKEDGSLDSYNSYSYNIDTMKRHGVRDCFLGFYTLIRGGVQVKFENTEKHPRQVIAEDYFGNHYFLTTEGRTLENEGMTIDDVCRILLEKGVKFAYMLDGGGSTSTVINGVKINDNIDKGTEDRQVATFIYCVDDDTNNSLYLITKYLGEMKQQILEKVVNITYQGYMNLYSPSKYPGIGFFPQDSKTRAGKAIMNFDDGFYISHRSSPELEEQNVLIANHNGLWSIDGKLGTYLDNPPTINDCNMEDKKSGIYLCTPQALNHPLNNQGYFYILHLKFNPNQNFIRQIAIPVTDSTIRCRIKGEDGEWKPWYHINVQRGSTTNRPTDAVMGQMYFDTVKKKPIWWDGSTWVDAYGDAV